MKKRILIIDDDKQLNQINQKVLVSSGLVSELHFAENGKEGLEYLFSRIEKGYPLPDIIIIDLIMPGMNGFEFIDTFNELEFHGKYKITLVVFTGSSNPNDKRRAVSKGIRHYLEKPYLLRGLNDVIHKIDCEYSSVSHSIRPVAVSNNVL